MKDFAATFTVIFLDRSPPDDGVAPSADICGPASQVAGHRVTLFASGPFQVRRKQAPPTSAELPSGRLRAKTRVTSTRRHELLHHGVMVSFQLQNLALNVHANLRRQVAARDGGRHLRDVAAPAWSRCHAAD